MTDVSTQRVREIDWESMIQRLNHWLLRGLSRLSRKSKCGYGIARAKREVPKEARLKGEGRAMAARYIRFSHSSKGLERPRLMENFAREIPSSVSMESDLPECHWKLRVSGTRSYVWFDSFFLNLSNMMKWRERLSFPLDSNAELRNPPLSYLSFDTEGVITLSSRSLGWDLAWNRTLSGIGEFWWNSKYRPDKAHHLHVDILTIDPLRLRFQFLFDISYQ